MKISKTRVLAGLVFAAGWLLAWGPACAQPAHLPAHDKAEIISRLQASYADMESFHASFTQELHHQQSATIEKRSGSLLFKKPMLIRWETDDPYPELLVVTESEIWNFLSDEELAYRYSLDMLSSASPIIVVITGQQALDKEFGVELLPDEDGLIHLLLYPLEPSPQMTEVNVWVDPAVFLIHSVMSMDFYGNTNKITFTDMSVSALPDLSVFTFSPPPGTGVEDMASEDILAAPLAF